MMKDKKSTSETSKSSEPKANKIDPDDVGVSKDEADQIIAELDDLTQEEVDEQARKTDR